MRIKYIYLTVLFFLSYNFCFSQKIKTYTIKPGESVTEVIAKKDQYLYDGFQKGIVFFKSGAKSATRLNFFLIGEELHFITETADTLAVANPVEISSVSIGRDIFYFDTDRYLEQDTVIGETILATSFFIGTINTEKIGAFGSTTDGGTDSYGSFVAPSGKVDLTPQVITTLALKRSLYIGDKYKKFIPVNKRNIYSVFSKKEQALKKYLSERTVDYFSRADIIQLVTFMSEQ